MKELIIFVIGAAVGAGLTLALKSKNENLSGINKERAKQKEQNKQKVLEFLVDKDEVANDDIERLLEVSNATAERYLDGLEQEGRLKQIGKIGRNVKYKVLK